VYSFTLLLLFTASSLNGALFAVHLYSIAIEAYNMKMKTNDEMLDTILSYETFSNLDAWKVK